MSHSVIFDIETAPLSQEFLDMIAPEFSAPGNYKDPEKIAASIAEQKLRWTERAALSPMTGKVLCIGIRDIDGSFRALEGNESVLLSEWTRIVDEYKNETFIGWNIWGFDLNFLQKRAAHLGVKPCIRWGFDFHRQDKFIDLMNLWSRFDSNVSSSLDSVAKFLGLGAKTGSGKDFSELWEKDREAAMAYLRNDIELTASIAQRMGVLC